MTPEAFVKKWRDANLKVQERDAVMTLSAPVGADFIRDDGADANPESRGCKPLPRAPTGEPEWPEADAIIGNPPFLGDKKMLAELGEEYVARLRDLYKGRVPGGADLVTYWFEKARAQVEQGKAVRAGLVATNSIRGGANRKALERIIASGRIFEAWSDEPWVNEGAAVRVSLICFDGHRATSEPSPQTPPALIGLGGEGLQTEPSSGTVQPNAPPFLPSPRGGGAGGEGLRTPIRLNGEEVAEIYADLTAPSAVNMDMDLTAARRLPENRDVAFMGITKVGPFDIPAELARSWLGSPNPHGKPNSDVLRPSANGLDVTRRDRDIWIIDFGTDMTEEDASLYEAPFSHVIAEVKPMRATNNREQYRRYWWRHGEARPSLRGLLAKHERYIATPEVAKHRVFRWFPCRVLPDKNLQVITRSDDVTFGILHSRFHELWSLKMCSWLGVGNDPRYTPTTTFETFPFPAGLTPNLKPEAYANPHSEAIAQAARRLNELRENWLNPPEWVERVPEINPSTSSGQAPVYPDRLIPKPGHEAELKSRTLTNLYNQRPAWLANAHQALDAAVAAAYGWPADLSEEEILRRLLALNRERSRVQ